MKGEREERDREKGKKGKKRESAEGEGGGKRESVEGEGGGKRESAEGEGGGKRESAEGEGGGKREITCLLFIWKLCHSMLCRSCLSLRDQLSSASGYRPSTPPIATATEVHAPPTCSCGVVFSETIFEVTCRNLSPICVYVYIYVHFFVDVYGKSNLFTWYFTPCNLIPPTQLLHGRVALLQGRGHRLPPVQHVLCCLHGDVSGHCLTERILQRLEVRVHLGRS